MYDGEVELPDAMIHYKYKMALTGYFCEKAKCDQKTPLELSVYRKYREQRKLNTIRMHPVRSTLRNFFFFFQKLNYMNRVTRNL